MFSAPDLSSSFSTQEKKILEFWKKNDVFQKTLSKNSKSTNRYVFYDGPPFATGLPHYGHLLASTIKDVVPRYQTMKGKYVERRFGWDCHGLPIEAIVEKKLNLSGSASIREYGIGRFNEMCRENVLTYTDQWQTVIERLGRWVDMENCYKTMDFTYMESVWAIFKQLFELGLVYEGYKVMPFSWKLGTELSNFEASDNYQEADDPSITVLFQDLEQSDLAYIVWTTTPWTLPANLALAVGAKMEYVEITLEQLDQTAHGAALEKMQERGIRRLVVAKERAVEIFSASSKQKDAWTPVFTREFLGSTLVGRQYRPLFNFFADTPQAFRICRASFLQENEGTGIVHIAPAFGEDDFELCQEEKIPLVCPVDQSGHFEDTTGDFSGLHYKDASKLIIKELKDSGQILWQKTIRHRVPFCWRTDTPLIYRACKTWFISVEKIRDRLVEQNKQVTWVPEHIKEGRFGKWIAQARDWAVSRNRFWGTPLPIWRNEDGKVLVLGSVQEMEELTNTTCTDLHRHKIDHLEIVIEEKGKKVVYRRIDAVFDCWFESGSMPYAQNHYPFSGKDKLKDVHPADFIAEGLDQTRGWFYTLMVLSTALFDKPAFKNVIVNGIILAENGQKMSKRLQNYPDPMEMMRSCGADALRLYLLKSPVVRGEDLCFSKRDVELCMRQVMLPWQNSHRFFLTYAHLYGYKPSQNLCYALPTDSKNLLDRWILSRLQHLTLQIEEAMSSYKLWQAVQPMLEFLEQLTNWYIRRARRRFWSEADTPDRRAAFDTLYGVLLHFSKLAAPFIPFLSETIYAQLVEPFTKSGQDENPIPLSVHLHAYPSASKEFIDLQLEEEMALVRRVVNMGHALRKLHQLKVRQPLARLQVSLESVDRLEKLKSYTSLIAEELNVLAVEFTDEKESFLEVVFSLNFRVAGKKLGQMVSTAKAWVAQEMTAKHLAQLDAEGALQVQTLDGKMLRLEREDIVVDYVVGEGAVASYSEGVSISLDTALTEQLIELGRLRELVNKVNTERKAQDLSVTQRIHLNLSCASDNTKVLEQLITRHKKEISEEILALEINLVFNIEESWQEFDLNGIACQFKISPLTPPV